MEYGEKRFGPYHPLGGPTSLHRYRAHKKTKQESRAERVEALSPTQRLELPRTALEGRPELERLAAPLQIEKHLTLVLGEAFQPANYVCKLLQLAAPTRDRF